MATALSLLLLSPQVFCLEVQARSSIRLQAEDEHDEHKEVALWLKLVALFSVFGAALIGVSIPVIWKQFRESPVIISHLNTFSGGLFLALAIVHVLPEAQGRLESIDYPIAETIAVVGYLIILFIEKILIDAHSAFHNHGNAVPFSTQPSSLALTEKSTSAKSETNETPVDVVVIPTPSPLSDNYHPNGTLLHTRSPYMLLLAVSVHTLLEGIALAAEDSTSGFLTFFTASILHKWAEAIGLSSSFIKAKRSGLRTLLTCLIFAFSGPVGIGIGIGISSTGNDVTIGVFQALAVGALIFVSVHEKVAEEFEPKEHRPTKFLLFVAGIGLICGLAAINKHDHGAEGHGGH